MFVLVRLSGRPSTSSGESGVCPLELPTLDSLHQLVAVLPVSRPASGDKSASAAVST